VQEKIIRLDDLAHCLQYSAIKTPSGVNHHLATIQLLPLVSDRSLMQWTTEIEPDQFVVAIEAAMRASVEGLRKVLGSER